MRCKKSTSLTPCVKTVIDVGGISCSMGAGAVVFFGFFGLLQPATTQKAITQSNFFLNIHPLYSFILLVWGFCCAKINILKKIDQISTVYRYNPGGGVFLSALIRSSCLRNSAIRAAMYSSLSGVKLRGVGDLCIPVRATEISMGANNSRERMYFVFSCKKKGGT